MSARTFAYHQLAKGYLDGINDATEGTAWCYTGRWKSDERDHALIIELAKLPPEVLRGNAAPLVLDFLRKKYPCPAGSTTKGELHVAKILCRIRRLPDKNSLWKH